MFGPEGLGFLDVRVRGFRFRHGGGRRMNHFNVCNYTTFIEDSSRA